MISVKTVYDNYPDRDLLPITIEVTEETTLADIEEHLDGDTLFLFLVRELCDSGNDECDVETAVSRCERAISDIERVRDGILELVDENHTGGVETDQQADRSSGHGAPGS